MLAGRVLSLAANFVVQVLIVGYLSTTHYGAFAYALSLVMLGETIVTVGVDRAIGRFLPIYEERRDWQRMFGTIVLVLGTIVALGLCVVLVVIGLSDRIVEGADSTAATLVAILIVLAPIQAADTVFANLLAVFASPRSIFLRRYVLAPALRLAVVGLLVLGRQDVTFLAQGYVATGAIGVAVYLALFIRIVRTRGLLAELDLRHLRFPVRELFAYTLPLLTTDGVYLVLNTVDAILLNATHGIESVAALRVVQPLVGLNQLVISSFSLLYTPAVSRLFARGHTQTIAELYWQTAIWMAVFTFPIFVLTFGLAGPVVQALYGDRYADSAILLTILAFARYLDVSLGFNGLTLRIFGRMRVVVAVNLLAVAVNVVLYVVLIPVLGPLGAALGAAGTLVVYNIAKQIALRRVAGIPAFELRYARVYVSILMLAIVSLVVADVVRPGLIPALALAALASLVVVLVNRDLLRVGATFPELRRLPFARILLGEDDRGAKSHGPP